jgi:hypothetical protein
MIFVYEATVGGNVVLTGTSDLVALEYSAVGGHVQVSETTGSSFLAGNSVTGNVVVLNNPTTIPFTGAGPSGSNLILGNTIGGNLVCTGNTPPPTDVYGPTYPNTAVNKVGQCT